MQAVTITPPDTGAVTTEQSALVQRAQAMPVSSEPEHREALESLQRIATMRKRVVSLFAESKRAAHQAHRAVCGAEAQLLKPLDGARRALEGKVLSYEAEARRRAEEERKRREEAARREAEEAALADAIAAAEAGDEEEAEAILGEADQSPVAAPAPAPEVARVEGVATRSTWTAEVENLEALVRYVAEKPEWLNLLKPDLVALRALARSQKGRLSIPGVRAVEQRGLSVGARTE